MTWLYIAKPILLMFYICIKWALSTWGTADQHVAQSQAWPWGVELTFIFILTLL